MAAAASLAVAESPDGIPVAPIPPSTFNEITNALRLRNDIIEVIVAPDLGRIAYIGVGQKNNLLRLDTELVKRGAAGMEFANFGGDWFWPVAQARWPAFNDGKTWPPPALLEKRPWQGAAWRNDDGSQSCLLRIEYGAPLNIKVSRRIRLDSETSRILISQRIERTDESTIPVTLWNVSQILGAQRAVVPAEQDVVTLGFNPPDAQITRCESSAVFNAQTGTEHKFGSTSPRGWIAAQRGDQIIVERATSDDVGGDFPDGGCRVELYSNTGLGYSEIETLSAEKLLKKGESLQNMLEIRLLQATSDMAPCDLADFVREQIGEKAVSPKPSP